MISLFITGLSAVLNATLFFAFLHLKRKISTLPESERSDKTWVYNMGLVATILGFACNVFLLVEKLQRS